MATTGNKTSAKKRHSNVAFDERATDTNYTETLKRLQVIHLNLLMKAGFLHL